MKPALPRSLRQVHGLQDFEPLAARRLPRFLREYIAGGAQDGLSLRANRAAFERVVFRPRVLVDTTARHTQVQTLGQTWAAPFGIAPMGGMGLAVRDADRAMARAAAAARIPFVLSGASLVPMADVLRDNDNAWFQAYLDADPAEQGALVRRVAACGFRTLVVTVDVPVAGHREADLRNGYRSPLRPSLRLLADAMARPRWLFGTLVGPMLRHGMPHFENFGPQRQPALAWRGARSHRRDGLDWAALERVRAAWPHRLVLKGVLAPEDATRARRVGVDGLIVSNHGGRQLDGAIAPLEALPAVRAATGPMEVLLDSGVRRGGDVLKALALGAGQVLLGRPFLWAAVVGGQAGVAHAIELLRAEILRDMALLGCDSLATLPQRVLYAGGSAHPGLALTPGSESAPPWD